MSHDDGGSGGSVDENDEELGDAAMCDPAVQNVLRQAPWGSLVENAPTPRRARRHWDPKSSQLLLRAPLPDCVDHTPQVMLSALQESKLSLADDVRACRPAYSRSQ